MTFLLIGFRVLARFLWGTFIILIVAPYSIGKI
jgi:hypothetical protein